MFRLLPGMIPDFVPVCGDSNDPATVEAGFRQRVLRADRPVADPARLAKLQAFVDKWCEENLPRVTPYEFEEWLAGTSYPEARKDELRLEYQSLKGGIPTAHQARKVTSFVKTEGYMEYKHVRLINSRGDAFKVFSGPAFKAIEDVLYQHPAFIKHVPVADRPKLVASLIKAGRRYYQTDFTAFESHFVPEVMRAIESRLYRYCLRDWKGLSRLLQVLEGENRMATRLGVRAKCQARRMSGEMCTSLGNGFTNYMLALFLVTEQGGYLDGFVEGDDGLFATDVKLDPEAYAKLGFTIKIDEITDPCTGSFCGMVFGPDGHILKDPRRFLANFAWTSSTIHAGEKIMKQLLRAKALSALYETPACPIISAVARRTLHDTRGVAPRFVSDWYHDRLGVPRDERALPSCEITRMDRELFHRLYGISPEVQLRVESAVQQGNFSALREIGVGPAMAHYATRYVEST